MLCQLFSCTKHDENANGCWGQNEGGMVKEDGTKKLKAAFATASKQTRLNSLETMLVMI